MNYIANVILSRNSSGDHPGTLAQRKISFGSYAYNRRHSFSLMKHWRRLTSSLPSAPEYDPPMDSAERLSPNPPLPPSSPHSAHRNHTVGLESLPSYILLLQLLPCMSMQDLSRIGSVCRRMYKCTGHDRLWRKFVGPASLKRMDLLFGRSDSACPVSLRRQLAASCAAAAAIRRRVNLHRGFDSTGSMPSVLSSSPSSISSSISSSPISRSSPSSNQTFLGRRISSLKDLFASSTPRSARSNRSSSSGRSSSSVGSFRFRSDTSGTKGRRHQRGSSSAVRHGGWRRSFSNLLVKPKQSERRAKWGNESTASASPVRSSLRQSSYTRRNIIGGTESRNLHASPLAIAPTSSAAGTGAGAGVGTIMPGIATLAVTTAGLTSPGRDEVQAAVVVARVLLVGGRGVGKTTLTRSFAGEILSAAAEREKAYEPTIGLEWKSRRLPVGGLRAPDVSVQLWELAEASVNTKPYEKSNAVVVIFDLTDRESFDLARSHLKFARRHGKPGITLMLLANKVDLVVTDPALRVVSRAEGKALADEMNSLFVETTAFDEVTTTAAFSACVMEQLVRCAIDDTEWVGGAELPLLQEESSQNESCTIQ